MGFSRQEYWSFSFSVIPSKEIPGLISFRMDWKGYKNVSHINKEEKNLAAMQEMQVLSLGWLGRSPGEGNGNPLQYSFLENPMDRGAWCATVYGITNSWT